MLDRRRFYRFWYPKSDRPKLRVGAEAFHVTELSEGGLRFEAQRGESFVGKQLDGCITFRDGSQCRVVGTVLRTHRDEVIVGGLEGITFGRALAEQRQLLKNYSDICSAD